MLVLGHLGLGRLLAVPWYRRFPPLAFFLGTLLPDLIDKPLYYGLMWSTGRRGLELGLISGTRTVGHMLLLALVVLVVSRQRRSPGGVALAIGMMTHQLLDVANDFLGFGAPPSDPTLIPGYVAVVWPALGWQFPVAPFTDAAHHAERLLRPATVLGEVLGGTVLAVEAWRHRSVLLRRWSKRR